MPSAGQIGRYAEEHRQHLLTALTALVVLILLVVLLRRVHRTHGLRALTRRAVRFLPGLARDLAAPLAGWLRHHRAVRLVAARARTQDPMTTAVDLLTLAAESLAGVDDCLPYRVALRAGHADAGIAGPALPSPPPGSGWQSVGARCWRTPLPVTRRPTAVQPHRPLPVLVGVTGRELVLLDLARAPGAVSVHGAPAPVRRLVAALTGQLRSAPAGLLDRLLIAETGLDQMLDRLAAEPVSPGRRTVLVCHQPQPAEAARIAALSRRDPDLIVVAAGYLSGSRWRLPVTATGRLVVPELGVDVWTGALGPGLARSGRPAAPGSPAAPAVPAGSGVPAGSDVPAGSGVPSGSGIPVGSGVPAGGGAPSAAVADDLIELPTGVTGPGHDRTAAVTARPGGR